jgi:2-polyprenyl-3-methyl-5-hydroxy-6-metoxy-1,4-benzoquinol methylase
LKQELQSSPPSIFFSTINRTLKSYALAIISAEYILGLIPPQTHDWNKFKTPGELDMVLRRENFSINRIQGIIPSFLNSIQNKNIDHKMRNQLLNGHLLTDWVLSDNDLDVNYILHAAPLKNKKDI